MCWDLLFFKESHAQYTREKKIKTYVYGKKKYSKEKKKHVSFTIYESELVLENKRFSQIYKSN